MNFLFNLSNPEEAFIFYTQHSLRIFRLPYLRPCGLGQPSVAFLRHDFHHGT